MTYFTPATPVPDPHQAPRARFIAYPAYPAYTTAQTDAPRYTSSSGDVRPSTGPKRRSCRRSSSTRSVTPGSTAAIPHYGHRGVSPSSIQSITSTAGKVCRQQKQLHSMSAFPNPPIDRRDHPDPAGLRREKYWATAGLVIASRRRSNWRLRPDVSTGQIPPKTAINSALASLRRENWAANVTKRQLSFDPSARRSRALEPEWLDHGERPCHTTHGF